MNRGSETGCVSAQYHNVEISIDGMSPAYVFRLRDISSIGMAVLVREDSGLLSQIEVGQTVTIKYNPAERSNSSEYFETEIRHISKVTEDQYKGHVIMGLSVTA